MNSQEEKIKRDLQEFAAEDFSSTWYDFKASTKIRGRQKKGNSFYEELSDWNNESNQIVSMQLPQLNPKQKDLLTQLNSMNMTEYRSSLFPSSHNKHEKKDFINPIVIRFNSKSVKSQQKNSKILFHKILQKEGSKKSSQPQQLRHLLERISHSEMSRYKEQSPPARTERCSSILRILKKRQKYRPFRRQVQNPQDITAVKIH